MIKTWRHKGLKDFYETGDRSKIPFRHAKKIALLLFQLANAIKPEDMNTPGNDFHKLTGNFNGFYAVKVNANWRIIFKFSGEDAILVDYVDYH